MASDTGNHSPISAAEILAIIKGSRKHAMIVVRRDWLGLNPAPTTLLVETLLFSSMDAFQKTATVALQDLEA